MKHAKINTYTQFSGVFSITVLVLIMLITPAMASGPSSREPSSITNKNSLSLKGNGMSFIENKGQVVDMSGHLRPDILYTGDGGGNKVYLRKTGISYVLSNMAEIVQEVEKKVEELRKQGTTHNNVYEQKIKDSLLQKQTLKLHRVDFDFVNANTNAVIETHDKLEGYNNYYYGHCPQGITHVNSYNQVIQKNIYNKIDVMYYGGKAQGLKYDIVINPGGNPKDIQLKYSGADNLKSEGGRLQMETSLGKIIEYMPKVYQVIEGKIVDVEAKYEIADMRSEKEKRSSQYSTLNTQIQFKPGTYNLHYPLIIDPWATYYGESASTDYSKDITTDNAGNVLITGMTESNSFPVLGGSQMTLGGFGDAFVVKFSPAGTRIWASYCGGSNGENGYGIATDNITGDVIITGGTYSTDFPVTAGGFQTALAAPNNFYVGDIFVVKYNPAGIIIWATYYGGSEWEAAHDIATDMAGNVYITGNTISADFPVSPGAFQMAHGGMVDDAFVVKFSPSGIPAWATCYGGSDLEFGNGIATDGITGDVIITGVTESADFPVTIGGFQTDFKGVKDVFVVKFSPLGTPTWATYYGGSDLDWSRDIATDNTGNVVITGYTYSADFPVTADGYQTIYGGTSPFVAVSDAFVVKYTPAGARTWATFYGEGYGDWGWDIATDASNNIYLYMEEEEPDTPFLLADACSYQPLFNGGNSIGFEKEDQLIVKFTPAGQKICATYMGGTGEDELETDGGGIAVYGNVLYITAKTKGGYPVTTGAYQTNFGGGTWDIFVASLCTNICEGKVLGLNITTNTTTVCSNVPINYTSVINNSCDMTGYQYQWTFAGASPATSTEMNPSNIVYNSQGSHAVKLIVTTPCGKDSVTNTMDVIATPLAVISGNNNICSGSNIILTASGGTDYSWSTGATTITIITVNPTSNTTYTLIATSGICSDTATHSVIITLVPTATISGNTTICSGERVTLTAATGNTYLWNNGTTTSVLTTTLSGTTSYTVIITNGGICNDTASVNIIVNALPAVTLAGNTSICKGDGASITASGGGSYQWNTGTTTASITTNHTTTTTYTLTVTNTSQCFKDTTITITVNLMPLANAGPDDTICLGENAALNASGGNSFTWSNGATTAGIIISPPATNTYTVNVSNGNCYDTDTAKVVVNTNPTANAGSDVTITTGTNITLSGSGGGSYLWSPATGLSCITCKQPVANPPQTTTYCMQLTDANGCTSSDCVTVTVESDCQELFVPTAFSPNSDISNELLCIYGTDCIKSLTFSIYDRWGEKVFETNDPQECWDGSYRNRVLTDAVVYFFLEAKLINKEKISKKGTITLIR